MSPTPNGSSSTDKVYLKIPGLPQYIGIVRLTVSGLAARLDLPFDEAEDLKLALTEACSHMLRSASGRADLWVDFQCSDGHLHISVQCVPAGAEASCQPPLHEQFDQAEPDLGIYLIEALVDSVDMETAEDGRIHSVTMSKRLAGGAESDR